MNILSKLDLYRHMSKRGLSLVDATPVFAHIFLVSFSFFFLFFIVVIFIICGVVLLRMTAEQ